MNLELRTPDPDTLRRELVLTNKGHFIKSQKYALTRFNAILLPTPLDFPIKFSINNFRSN